MNKISENYDLHDFIADLAFPLRAILQYTTPTSMALAIPQITLSQLIHSNAMPDASANAHC